MALWLTIEYDVNRQQDDDPFALLIEITLDQHYLWRALAGPKRIAERVDGIDIAKIAAVD